MKPNKTLNNSFKLEMNNRFGVGAILTIIRAWILFIIPGVFCGCSSENAEKEVALFPIFEALDFKAVPGEKLIYEVSAGLFDVGDVSIQVRDSLEKIGQLTCFRIDARASSKSGISWISKVKHDWSSWVDTSTGRSVKLKRDVTENGYRAQQETFFWPDSQSIVQYDLHKEGKPFKTFKARPDQMRDLVNIIWQLRYTPFEENKQGDTLKYLAFFDSQWLIFKVRLAGMKEIKKAKSKRKFYILYPIGIESKYLKGKNPVEVWIEADPRRRPYRVQVSSYIGQLAVRLKN
jgi:hypothetical protein